MFAPNEAFDLCHVLSWKTNYNWLIVYLTRVIHAIQKQFLILKMHSDF